MRTRPPARIKLTAQEKGDDAMKINLTGMEPEARKDVEAAFRHLYRSGKLDLPAAFSIINQYEGTPAMKAWKRDRQEYESWKESIKWREPNHAKEFLDLPPKPL